MIITSMGQLASATIRGETEDFLWDGLALVKRGKRGYMNEPHVGGGAPIATDDGVVYFNDMLGSSIAATKGDKTASVGMTSFGDNGSKRAFYTGKPQVEGLGYAFLMRNYRADLGKWQTADPMGYPDGWNQLAYCCNGVTTGVDLWGCKTTKRQDPTYNEVTEKALSGWIFDYVDKDGNKVYYSIWESYTKTKWDFYTIVPDKMTELEEWKSKAKQGLEFSGMLGGVVVAVVGVATGGTAYLIGGVAVSAAAFLAYLIDDYERTVEVYELSTIETSTKRFKKYKTVAE